MNRIEINFETCSPAPSGGYNIKYRVAGSDDIYRDAGNFFMSPAVFYDTENPAGTCYEGFIRSGCGEVLGNPVNFSTCESESGDPDLINYNYINSVGLGGVFRIIVNGTTVVLTSVTESGTIAVAPGDTVQVIVQSTLAGTAEINISGPYNNSTSQDHVAIDAFTVLPGTYIIDGQSQ